MKAKRSIIFHVGGIKTGSSALQMYFNINKKMLKKYDIAYEHEPKVNRIDAITSGNGLKLYEAVGKIETNDKTLDKIIESYFNDTLPALCSS